MNRNDLLPFDEVDYHSAITTAVKAIETLLIERRRRARFLPEWTVEHRSKGIASIRKKLQRKQAEKAGYTAASMTDIAGVRVIVESAFTAKKFAQYVRDRMLFTVREEDSEEFIDSPRGDGYRGIHIVLAVRVKRVSVKMVPVELQIRSILQHQWTELSQSEFYKSIAEIPPSHLSRMLALSDILHSAEIEAETLRREKILDECRFSLLRALRRDVLEQLRPGSASHPTQPEQIGRLANGLLEIDKQLRKTLLSFGQAEKLAMDALVALTEGMDDPSLQKTLGNIVQRVRGVVESFPSDPMTRGGRR